MVPYRGRLALRVARVVVAFASSIWFVSHSGFHLTWVMALMAAYAVYSIGALLQVKFDSPVRAAIGSSADAGFLALWCWLDPASWPAVLAAANLLVPAAILQDLVLALAAVAAALFLAVVVPLGGSPALVWAVVALSASSVSVAAFKRFLSQRMSNTLRHNVIIRSQAEGAREAERQRIAADFHDGPLQNFIGFQMRLEIIRKLIAKDVAAAAEELRQLQDLCKGQVADLRSFVRSMRPTDEGMSLSASLSRMADSFQRDTGIAAAFAAGEVPDPGETEISLELLQIVREALNNVQKHSSASRVAISASRRGTRLEIAIEDNGGGFPFTGAFTLEELELLRTGPASIKRRVRMLNGELTLESRPGQGARLEIRVPV
jgi:signal transduction histidine kinase